MCYAVVTLVLYTAMDVQGGGGKAIKRPYNLIKIYI